MRLFRPTPRWWGVLILATGLVACRSGADEAAPESALPGGEPVSVEQLQALFPDAVGTLPRLSVEGDVEGALGFQVSRAAARYGAGPVENRPHVTIAVLDTGSTEMAGHLGFSWGVAPAASEPVDEASTPQAMSTLTLYGHPARRTADSGARPRLEILVGGRFHVEASGVLVDPDVLDVAVRGLDLERLAALARQAEVDR